MDPRDAGPAAPSGAARRLALGRVLPLLLGAAAAVLLGWWLQARPSVDDATDLPSHFIRPPTAERAAPEALPSSEATLDETPATLTLPSGAPTRISCEDAQRVTAFLHRELAAPPVVPQVPELAEVWGVLLDPHGLWSAAPDSPLQAQLNAAARGMLASLHEQSPGCPDAERVAEVWQAWQVQLATAYAAAYASARAQPAPTLARVFELSAEPIFQDDPVTRPGLELARELGTRLGSFVARFPEQVALADQARARFLPAGKDALTDIAILAALRAYVPLVDPHGDFAVDDEEWALYAGDDTLDAGSALWRDMTRTALGARIVDGPTAPLELDDLVLSINGLSLAGASVEQIEQAARSADGGFQVRVLRQGEPKLLTLQVAADEPGAQAPGLEFERIGYGSEPPVLRVVIPDVGDGLGAELEQALQEQTPGTSAVLLDLRGNGGGSLDAAVESLGLLLPGARLFPLVHRGYVTEVLQAPSPAYVYSGPVAALVDGDTASAAEMLAGALQAYGRGSLIGARTFGKGCVQEYFDQVVGTGVLRMTTLQFVMPNGKPLQQIGLTPELLLPLAPALERESEITRQPITFAGPDVRDRKIGPGPVWPRASARPGPCSDPVVCAAVSRLAGVRPGAARATRQSAGTR